MNPSRSSQLLLSGAAIVASIYSLPVAAQILPAAVRAAHPRILAHQTDFDRLRAQLPIAPANFPYAGGTVSFKFTPQAGSPTLLTPLFSDYSAADDHIFVRHLGDKDTANTVQLQIGLQKKGYSSYIAAAAVNVPINSAATTVSISWNATSHTACYSIGGGPCVAMNWQKQANGLPVDWLPLDQNTAFVGRENENPGYLVVQDLNHNTVFSQQTPGDAAINSAWVLFARRAGNLANVLSTCQTAEPTAQPAECDVANGARGTIYQNARDLALVYRMTGKPVYKEAAFNYLDMLFAVTPVTTGTEWSMGGRMSALGYLYDWMYADVTQRLVPNDVQGRNYAQKIVDTMKLTLTGRSDKPSVDLSSSICGLQPIIDRTVSFDCEKKPVYQNWNRLTSKEPTISPYYISGHHFSAISETTTGLLAIASEHPEVLPLIETAYSHFDKGFMPSHGRIAVDGGYPTGYAYGAAGNQFGERLLMWRKALEDTRGAPVFSNDWTSELIYPYIYALRHDGKSFPALGDNFEFYVTAPLLGEMALSTAIEKNDMVALAFYKQVIAAKRGADNADVVIERLLYPASGQAGDLQSLEKSRLFRQSGQVLMRDSWDYPNATLLEFKSSSFISQNHQHMDQNSISLNYKAPLLLDSGLYDTYGSSHWYDYYTRTIAHNSVVVFDGSENFAIGSTQYSNDGGQWFHRQTDNNPVPYPTPEETAPGAINYLDGITRYENAANYTYTVGNASKAYGIEKLDQDNGFVRSVLFVRPDDATKKPVTVIFDRVQPKKALTATFLLHTANRPAVVPGLSYLSDGQYQVRFSDGDYRKLTIRNGGGMATVQTLLPLNAGVLIVGGKNVGATCTQAYLSASGSATPPEGSTPADCRFTVRERQANGTYLWRNYTAQISTQQRNLVDVGAYRVEVSAPGTASANQPQYFLHVLSVADNDGRSDVAALDSAVRLSADANTEAVLLSGQTIAVLNRDSAPAAGLGWTSALSTPAIIATGLKLSSAYVLNRTPVAGGYRFQLVETPDGSGALHSSTQGVISFSY
ncbi:heparinase II/III family protein [Rugamonas sp. CCM 8940]|uniref:heparinase II/III domain-containing protein n=1 Tax=Rugamonas sp. CCM 8940 TaxID=2765359 RepID=UPI0018F3EC3F|nr:heparinase II/III family protein [Rugamonas sp. CCM 8940]MBJ7314278.1 heparinase II/III family protein [Rugamonas sp. CCM 8940]